jgi:hypothetical protein
MLRPRSAEREHRDVALRTISLDRSPPASSAWSCTAACRRSERITLDQLSLLLSASRAGRRTAVAHRRALGRRASGRRQRSRGAGPHLDSGVDPSAALRAGGTAQEQQQARAAGPWLANHHSLHHAAEWCSESSSSTDAGLPLASHSDRRFRDREGVSAVIGWMRRHRQDGCAPGSRHPPTSEA